MSQTSNSPQTKNLSGDAVETRSKSKKASSSAVLNVKPITTVAPTVSQKNPTKAESTVKKAKSTKVSDSSPSILSKSVKGKSKKKKGEISAKRGLSMHDLYVSEDPFGMGNVESHVDTSVKDAIGPNVESSVKISDSVVEKVAEENPITENHKPSETLDVPRSVVEEHAEKTLSKTMNVDVAVPDKATPMLTSDIVKEKEIAPDVAKDAEASKCHAVTTTESLGDSSDSEAATDVEEGKDDEFVADSEPEISKEKSDSVDHTESEKTVTADQNVVDVDDLNTEEESPPKPVQRRLRSRTPNPTTSVQVTPAAKKGKDKALKPVKYGPKKGWSKSVPPPEKKKTAVKRKNAPSSDSDFDAEADAPSIKHPAKKAMSAKKAAQEIEDFPCDNVSFHLASYAQRWGIICKRRFALEREIGKEILGCEEVIKLIQDAGLIKTVWGLSNCYEKLIRELSLLWKKRAHKTFLL